MGEYAKQITVIETLTRRGVGTETDPVRYVRRWWALDGELLAESDPMQPTTPGGDRAHAQEGGG